MSNNLARRQLNASGKGFFIFVRRNEMPILKHFNHAKDHFTTLPNTFLQDQNITYEAKGLLCELLSRPEDWIIRKKQLLRPHTGETKISRIVKELTAAGYLYCMSIRTEDNSKIKDRIWIASAVPVEKKVFQDFNGKSSKKDTKTPGFLNPGKPQFKETLGEENPPLYKKRLIQRKINKNKIKKLPSFTDTLQYIPDHLKDNKDFVKSWKEFFRYRKTQIPKSAKNPVPLTFIAAKKQLNKFQDYSAEICIASINTCLINCNIGAFPENASWNGNGKSTPKTPAPKKKKPKEQMTPNESGCAEQVDKATGIVIEYLSKYDSEPDENLIRSQLEIGADYLCKLYDKVDAYRKESEEDYEKNKNDRGLIRARIWMEHLPTLPFIIERYIKDLSTWVREPSAGFFKWDYKTFVKFRNILQRTYFEYDWEKGTTLS